MAAEVASKLPAGIDGGASLLDAVEEISSVQRKVWESDRWKIAKVSDFLSVSMLKDADPCIVCSIQRRNLMHVALFKPGGAPGTPTTREVLAENLNSDARWKGCHDLAKVDNEYQDSSLPSNTQRLGDNLSNSTAYAPLQEIDNSQNTGIECTKPSLDNYRTSATLKSSHTVETSVSQSFDRTAENQSEPEGPTLPSLMDIDSAAAYEDDNDKVGPAAKDASAETEGSPPPFTPQAMPIDTQDGSQDYLAHELAEFLLELDAKAQEEEKCMQTSGRMPMLSPLTEEKDQPEHMHSADRAGKPPNLAPLKISGRIKL